jgi:hypothetical protein
VWHHPSDATTFTDRTPPQESPAKTHDNSYYNDCKIFPDIASPPKPYRFAKSISSENAISASWPTIIANDQPRSKSPAVGSLLGQVQSQVIQQQLLLALTAQVQLTSALNNLGSSFFDNDTVMQLVSSQLLLVSMLQQKSLVDTEEAENNSKNSSTRT